MTYERQDILNHIENLEEIDAELSGWMDDIDSMTSDIEKMHSIWKSWGIDSDNALSAFQELGRFRDKVERKLTETRRDVRDFQSEIRRIDGDLSELPEAP